MQIVSSVPKVCPNCEVVFIRVINKLHMGFIPDLLQYLSFERTYIYTLHHY